MSTAESTAAEIQQLESALEFSLAKLDEFVPELVPITWPKTTGAYTRQDSFRRGVQSNLLRAYMYHQEMERRGVPSTLLAPIKKRLDDATARLHEVVAADKPA